MSIVKTKKIPARKESAEDVLSKFCYYFPQYTYLQAKKLPYKRVIKLLSAAKKERAKMMYDLTIIVSAPHTKKGAGVKKLINDFKEIIQGD